jgi:hypothetical protein
MKRQAANPVDVFALMGQMGLANHSYLDDALPEQQEMIASKFRKKAAVCGRRAGKTTGCFLALIHDGQSHPNCIYPYLLPTRAQARYSIWPILLELESKYHFGLRFNESRLEATLPNGSKILVLGADSVQDQDKIRGGKYRKVIVDEAGTFPREQIGYLMESVLEPATMDLLGEIWLVGTPNPAAQGYFYDKTHGSSKDFWGPGQIPTWYWTALSNKFLPHARAEMERIQQENGWNWESPIVQREHLGRWFRDASGLVYRFDRSKHLEQAPDDLAYYVLGVDLGSSLNTETTAFVLLGYRKTGQTVWVVKAEKGAFRGPDPIADKIREYVDNFPITQIVCDAGGLGNGYILHFNDVCQLPVIAAEKREKCAHIEFVNGALDGKKLLVDPSSAALIGEIEILPWNEKRTDSAPGCPDHACDAMLYGYRACTAYANQDDPAPPPVRGSKEASNQFERAWRDDWSSVKQRQKKSWWEMPGGKYGI